MLYFYYIFVEDWIGINKFPADFEKSIFDLSKDGAISAPVQTNAGWHILKRSTWRDSACSRETETRVGDRSPIILWLFAVWGFGKFENSDGEY